jgi:hypothetical protein
VFDYGFRFGLGLLLILLIVGFVGVAMLAIAWKLYNRDRVGRGLAYAFAGTLFISVVFSSDKTAAETFAMIISKVGVSNLALAPRVRALFDRSTSPDNVPSSVIVSRTLIAIFTAAAVLIALSYILLATYSAGEYVVAGIVNGAFGVGASLLSQRLNHADRDARLQMTIGGAVYMILLLVFGHAAAGLLIPFGLVIAAVGFLWVPNDARRFFGDDPLTLSAQ